MISGKTGLVVPADDSEGLLAAVKAMVDNPVRISQMAVAARKFVEERSFEGAFLGTWQMYYQDHLGSLSKAG